jgi:Flp pilus assembly pilin Flp
MTIAIQQIIHRLQDEDRGAGLAEYALLLVLISIASIVIMGQLGQTINGVFTAVDDALTP